MCFFASFKRLIHLGRQFLKTLEQLRIDERMSLSGAEVIPDSLQAGLNFTVSSGLFLDAANAIPVIFAGNLVWQPKSVLQV